MTATNATWNDPQDFSENPLPPRHSPLVVATKGGGFSHSCEEEDCKGKNGKGQPSLLHRRFPFLFESDTKELFHPTPEGMGRFLRSLKLKPNERDIIVELLQLTEFTYNGELKTCAIGDKALATRAGIDSRNISRYINSAKFQKWVGVDRGKVWVAGKDPEATVYDLMKLMTAFGEWKETQ